MAVAYDAYSNLAAGTGTRSWSHAGGASDVNGIIVVIAGAGADETTAVTYNSLPLTEVQVGNNPSGESGTVAIWCLNESVPSGTNTVQITRSGTEIYIASAFTVTAVRYTEIVALDSGASNNASTDTLSLTIPDGFTVAMFGGLFCGENALTSITSSADIGGGTPGGVNSADFGNSTAVINYRTVGLYTGTGNAYSSFSWTWTSDDGAWAAIAVREAPIYKLASAAVTVTPTASAVPAALSKTQTATGVALTTPTTAAGSTSKPAMASTTVSPTAAASAFLLQPQVRTISGTNKTYGTVTGRLGTLGIQNLTESAAATTMTVTAAASATVTKTATASATVTPSTYANGGALGFPESDAHVTITTTAAATPTVTKPATASATVAVSTTATCNSLGTMSAAATTVAVTAQAFAVVEGQPVYESWGPIPILAS